MKKRNIIIFLLSAFIAFIIYFVFIRDPIPVVEELPNVMQNEFEVVYDESNRVSLEKNGVHQSMGIIFDKEKTLYIANSVGDNISKFRIDKNENEIYLFKFAFSYHEGDNDKFQLITVPYSKYKEIINNNKLTVYIDYGGGQEIREYNVNNGDYELIEYSYPTSLFIKG